MNGPASLQSDRQQIEAFVSTLFRYADEGTFISLRCFDQVDRGVAPILIKGVAVPASADFAPIVDAAIWASNRAANNGTPGVFAPPVATFAGERRARTEDLANGVALSVELDGGDCQAAQRRLEAIIGPVTVATASGGEWTDPATGEVHPKMHLHWRLSEPTRNAEEHDSLRLARWSAAVLVGGDMTAAPLAHPLRWPGSWNLKKSPRLSRIVTLNEAAEVHLQEALEKLQLAVEAAGLEAGNVPESVKACGAPLAPIEHVVSALAAIPNADVSWDEWTRLGMAAFRATGGDQAGLDAWDEWSAKSTKYRSKACAERWKHYAGSKPTKIGAGTIFMMAAAAGWDRRKEFPPEPPEQREDDPWHEQEGARHGTPVDGAPRAADKPKATRIIDPTTLYGLHVPERRWIVPEWLPCGHVTLNYGDGGTGKTLLAQQLMTSCATELPWIGMAVKPCRVFAFFCEDDADELHRRQVAICEAYGISLADLGDMRWISGVGDDNLLVTFDQDGRLRLTPRYEEIVREAKEFGAELIVIDTAADTFGGNENDRSQVRQFIGHALNGLAIATNGAVLLNAHPSRSGLSATGDMDGGSTGWSNSARSRWSLSRPKGEDGEPADTNERILTKRKANYSAIGDDIKLRWVSGVLAPPARPGAAFAGAYKQIADNVFLRMLRRSYTQERWVSLSRNAGNFAPKVFAKAPDTEGHSAKDFSAAMERLLHDGKIKTETYGRFGYQRLAPSDEPGDAP